MSAVELRGVEKHFGPLRALRGIDLEVPEGTALLVSGPNGAGKSTLLRVLSGLMRPTRGSVSVLGRPLYSAAGRAARARVGFLGSQAGLYAELSVRENLEFQAQLHGVGKSRIDRVIEELGLAPRASQPVRTLSFGFRRRAGLARALLTEPDLVLLDEPWNGLDREAASMLDRVLAALRLSGPTLLVVSHDPERARLFGGEIRLVDGVVAA